MGGGWKKMLWRLEMGGLKINKSTGFQSAHVLAVHFDADKERRQKVKTVLS